MIGCARCEAVNPDGYRFCGQCGSPLETLACPSCGTGSPPGQSFCGSCGAPLGGAARPGPAIGGAGAGGGGDEPFEALTPVEERKLATVLFADVVGFTSLAERTDHEVVAHMVDAAFQEIGKVVADHGGTVDKYMGDSLMAVFGVPTAHDDDAERAVAAGLAIRRLGGDLVFSIGVNSGEVMVSVVGRGDATVIGDTVNVAARLEKAASPGEVLCGRLTAELARHHVEFQERQPVLLKGKQEPVEVWAALRVRRGASGDGGHEGGAERPPLVGRDDERSYLERQVRRLHSEAQAALVVICGEAGAGKTRLLDELADLAAQDAHIVRAAYPGYGVMGGLQVAVDLIDQLGPSADPEVEARVRSVLGEPDPVLRAMDPPAVEREQLWGLGRLIKEKAAERPLVVLVDDLHWADDTTLELLERLASSLRDIPLLTVVAGRTDPGSWLARFSSATTLRLRALARAQAEALAEALVGSPLAEDARSFLVDMAKGNPLYLRELVAVAKDRSLFVADGHALRMTPDRVVPASLQALLAARLDALDRDLKVVFQHLALLNEATDNEVAELAGRDCAAEVRALARTGLVRQGPDGRYEPADPLLAEVAYDMLPRAARGELHRRAAAVVGRPDGRVRHLERATEYLGEDPQLAVEASEVLAVEGLALIEGFRQPDAMGLLERSVELGMRRPDVLLELARIQAACGKPDEALDTLALIPDDPDDPALAVERDHTAAAGKMFSDPEWSLARLERIAERWRVLGNTNKEAWAHANAGVSHFYLSRTGPAADELELALELFESVGDRPGAVSVTSFLCLARPADPRVDTWLEEALAYADETGDRNRQLSILASLAWKQFFRSLGGTSAETAGAEAIALRLAEIAQELGALDMAMHGHSLRALMARLTGRFDLARSEASTLARLVGPGRVHSETWLAWAAGFAVAVSTDSPEAAAPFPPEGTVDPVVAMAWLMVETALVLAGRIEEAVTHRARGRPALDGPMGDLGGLVSGLAMVLAGHHGDAGPVLERTEQAAAVLGSAPAALGVDALLAEIGQHATPPPNGQTEPGLAPALVLRARALRGDSRAAEELRRMSEALAAPGLLTGMP